MFILLVLIGIVFLALMLYVGMGAFYGVAMGIEYWRLRGKRAPLPTWVAPIRTGWHVIFGIIAVYKTFGADWLIVPGAIMIFCTFGVFIDASRQHEKYSKFRLILPRQLLP